MTVLVMSRVLLLSLWRGVAMLAAAPEYKP